MEVRIKPHYKWYELNLKEFWEYKDLIYLFVKRNYSTRYKQTILGPLWLLIWPLFTITSYTIVFGGLAGLSTDGVPKPLFYLSGNILWSFFASSLSNTSGTFLSNAGIFGKVYYPRIIAPISTVIISFLDFLVQFVFLLLLACLYAIRGQIIEIHIELLLLPLLILELGLLGMGLGILISSMTTKYRDLNVLVGFGLQIWMYASPVIYSTTLVPDQFMNIFMLNPVTPVILAFKYGLFGIGEMPYFYLGISSLFTVFIVLAGAIVFNKVEKTFLDTI